MPTAPTLNDKLTEAQREADQLRERLSEAEYQVDAAVAEKRFADAEAHKAAADSAREPLLIAEAHVAALQAGVQALADHNQRENLARQERERKEQASATYDRCKQTENEAMEDLNRLQAEIRAAYGALRQTMAAAIDAEQRVGNARTDAWSNGIVGGQMHPDYPRPARPNSASARIESTPVLNLIWRTPQLP